MPEVAPAGARHEGSRRRHSGLRHEFEKPSETEAALCSYVASQEQAGSAFDDPYLAFAFCYLASHFGLGLISEEYINEVMAFLESAKSS